MALALFGCELALVACFLARMPGWRRCFTALGGHSVRLAAPRVPSTPPITDPGPAMTGPTRLQMGANIGSSRLGYMTRSGSGGPRIRQLHMERDPLLVGAVLSETADSPLCLCSGAGQRAAKEFYACLAVFQQTWRR